MTTQIEQTFTSAQLAKVLSALDDKRRNPASKREAIAAIERSAKRYDLTAAEVLEAADALLDDRMTPAAFRAVLRDEDAPLPIGGEPAEACIMPNAGPLAADEADEADEAEAEPAETKAPRHGSKLATLIELLSRPEGATAEQIMEATGWQKHSVRGAIAGTLKKKHGRIITTEKVRSEGNGGRGSYTIYRIVA